MVWYTGNHIKGLHPVPYLSLCLLGQIGHPIKTLVLDSTVSLFRHKPCNFSHPRLCHFYLIVLHVKSCYFYTISRLVNHLSFSALYG